VHDGRRGRGVLTLCSNDVNEGTALKVLLMAKMRAGAVFNHERLIRRDAAMAALLGV
jgi:hypothetical protein